MVYGKNYADGLHAWNLFNPYFLSILTAALFTTVVPAQVFVYLVVELSKPSNGLCCHDVAYKVNSPTVYQVLSCCLLDLVKLDSFGLELSNTCKHVDHAAMSRHSCQKWIRKIVILCKIRNMKIEGKAQDWNVCSTKEWEVLMGLAMTLKYTVHLNKKSFRLCRFQRLCAVHIITLFSKLGEMGSLALVKSKIFMLFDWTSIFICGCFNWVVDEGHTRVHTRTHPFFSSRKDANTKADSLLENTFR